MCVVIQNVFKIDFKGPETVNEIIKVKASKTVVTNSEVSNSTPNKPVKY